MTKKCVKDTCKISYVGEEIHILLTSGKICKIDKDDEWVLLEFNLYSLKSHVTAQKAIETEWGYAKFSSYLHKIITKTSKINGFQIDHINRDGHDNRKSNLRHASARQNMMNKSFSKNSTIPFKGVSVRSNHETKKYGAFFRHTETSNNLGYFETAEKAASVYDVNALASDEVFAFQNFPQNKEKYLGIIKKLGLSRSRVLVMSSAGFKIKESSVAYASRGAPTVSLEWCDLGQ